MPIACSTTPSITRLAMCLPAYMLANMHDDCTPSHLHACATLACSRLSLDWHICISLLISHGLPLSAQRTPHTCTCCNTIATCATYQQGATSTAAMQALVQHNRQRVLAAAPPHAQSCSLTVVGYAMKTSREQQLASQGLLPLVPQPLGPDGGFMCFMPIDLSRPLAEQVAGGVLVMGWICGVLAASADRVPMAPLLAPLSGWHFGAGLPPVPEKQRGWKGPGKGGKSAG